MRVECIYCGKDQDADEFRYRGCCGEVHSQPCHDLFDEREAEDDEAAFERRYAGEHPDDDYLGRPS